MVESGEHLRFALEPRQTLCILRELARQHLDGDVTLQLYVARSVDRTHPTLADLLEDRTQTCTPLREEDFKYSREGRRINLYLIRCPFPFTRVTRSALQSEGYGHPGGHLARPRVPRTRPSHR
jgi:hypothetical protein